MTARVDHARNAQSGSAEGPSEGGRLGRRWRRVVRRPLNRGGGMPLQRRAGRPRSQ
jgi:hypothetical protein